MSPGLARMFVTFIAMGLMFLAIISIMISREKLKGVVKVIVSTFAYICMVTAGLIVFIIVFSGPGAE